MSYRFLKAAWKADTGTHTAKLVLIALADYANDQGTAWPSMSTLAGRCSLSKRAVIMNIGALEKRGLISKRKALGKGSIYTLQLVNEDHHPVNEDHQSTGEPESPPGEPESPVLVHEDHQPVHEDHPNPQYTPEELPKNPQKKRAKKSSSRSSSFDPLKVELPHGLKLRSSWGEWCSHRSEIKAKLTPIAVQKQVNMLGEHSEDQAVEIINNSILNGWRGLFPDSIKSSSQKTNGVQPRPLTYKDGF